MKGFENPNSSSKEVQDWNDNDFHPDVDAICQKAEGFFSLEAIKEDSFADLYGQENIDRDKSKVQNRRAHWKENNAMHTYATALEYLIYQRIKNNNGFGENVDIIKTAEYDDVMNGTDLVVEFEQSEAVAPERLGLAIDVTFGSKTLGKKFDNIKKQIQEGKLGNIKYFQSVKQGFRGELSLLPRVVIGIEKAQIEKLASLFQKGGAEAMKEHPTTRAFLHETSVELRTFADYAERQRKPQLAAIYKRELTIIQSIIRAGYGNDMNLDEVRGDRVLQSIRTALGEKF